MLLPVLAVYDKKTALLDKPFLVRHVGEAIRDWDVVRKDKETKFGKTPEDFDLYQIAKYDDETGLYENLQPRLQIATGV